MFFCFFFFFFFSSRRRHTRLTCDWSSECALPICSRAGWRAAGSHTAALAASDVAVDALFHQSGVIRADTIDEMFDIAACLDAQPLPAGLRVGIDRKSVV